MNGFNLSDITDARLGGTHVSTIYLGYTKLWPLAIDYSREYLTIKSLADNNTIRFNKNGTIESKNIYWSSDKITWNSVSSSISGTTLKTLSKNEKIYIKGSNNSYATTSGYNYFSSDYEFNISGNIMSLLYGDNFIGQTTLPSATYNFYSIFRSSKVVDASNLILPATTLTDYCYYTMFSGCSSLTTAPALPATTLANYCYSQMFANCTALTTAPALPATTLANYCYIQMFYGCTSLTTAPELPATTLSSYCYYYMFGGCSSLNYIKMLATDISATNCLKYWVDSVASTGTFVKDYNLKSIPINSASGIPTGWTVEEVNKPDYSQEYLTIESLADNNTISWFLSDANYGINKTIAWSTDKTNWTSVTSHYSSPGRTITTLNTGDKIYLKGTNTQLSKGSAYCKFNSTGNYNVYGNIMSLLYGDNFIGQTTLPSATYNFYSIFRSSKVVDASNLILPATTLTDYCYAYMFMGCTALTSAPSTLPATTLSSYCYANMFDSCTSLTTAPELPATTLANSCYSEMFSDCTSLTTAPELPATTLTGYCYYYMFYGCTSLSYIKCLATNISESSGRISWVSKVASTGTFVKPSSMTSWPTGSNGIPSGWTVVNI